MEVTQISNSPATTPLQGEATGQPLFGTTHWSAVLAAGRGDVPEARAALEELCRTYWQPLYIYVRRRGYSPADAEDLTQDFFAWVLERNWLGDADQQRGRFRSFLQISFNHFLANERVKARAQKRGAGRIVSLQFHEAESGCAEEPADHFTPEQSYEWHWALTLLDRVLNRLSRDYSAQGKAQLFGELKPCLLGERATQSYTALASRLDITEGAVKVAVFRLRRRYRRLLRDEIANTVAKPEEIEEEIRHLFTVLARR